MAPDEMRNLGFKEEEGVPAAGGRSIEGEAAVRVGEREKKNS